MSDREFPLEIEQLAQSLSSIRKVLDFDAMEKEIATLQEEAGDPNLWNDQENAARVTSKLARLQNEIERIEKLVSRVDDVRVLVELAEGENDADTLAEAINELDFLNTKSKSRNDYDQRVLNNLLDTTKWSVPMPRPPVCINSSSPCAVCPSDSSSVATLKNWDANRVISNTTLNKKWVNQQVDSSV